MKIEVHLQGGLRKIIDIDPRATWGATIGQNVFNADGTLFVPTTSGSGQPVAVTSWELILNIPPNVAALAAFSGTGIYTITGPGTSAGRSIVGAAGQIDVADGSGVAGNPTLSLADVADAGGGALLKTTFDTKGRQTGSSPAELGDLSDVDLVTVPPADGNALVWDDAAGKWVPGASAGGVQSVVAGTGIDVDDTDPANPIVALDSATQASLALADSAVQSVVGGANVSVDSTDPQNPVVNVTMTPPTETIQASENLAAGDFVRVHNSGGARVRRADYTAAAGDGVADGFVLAAVTSGNPAAVYFDGRNDQLSGLTPGDLYVLSTNGDVVEISTLPATSGTILQVLGTAISATELSVNIQSAILRE